ncbi:hypothetical protein B0I12_002521 [Microbacterium hydrothermale]|uniref:DUF6551 family protein n=1 Tax=Microbacterium hydrothermale TaxID=857427 RepID=UPI0022268C0E|nr:DUF6551 family protein [Microbacterium hydrothermale]MCW2165366.1 hypothetical protein [Microbacterium hydrothermale]
MSNTTTPDKRPRNIGDDHGSSRITTVKLGQLRVSSAAQREFSDTWGEFLEKNFNLDLVGMLTVSFRDGVYWVVDGQHRTHGLISWAKREFGDEWQEWTVHVNCHYNLSERAEAALFLAFNNRRTISAYDKFTVGVTADLAVPTDINRVVLGAGLRVDKARKPGSVSAVGALEYVYRLGDAVLLRKTLNTIRDAWAGTGFDSDVIRGVALVINRYEGRVDEERLVKRLSAFANGARGVRQRAYVIKDSHGSKLDVAHAAAITDIYNAGLRGGASLGSWWKDEVAA